MQGKFWSASTLRRREMGLCFLQALETYRMALYLFAGIFIFTEGPHWMCCWVTGHNQAGCHWQQCCAACLSEKWPWYLFMPCRQHDQSGQSVVTVVKSGMKSSARTGMEGDCGAWANPTKVSQTLAREALAHTIWLVSTQHRPPCIQNTFGLGGSQSFSSFCTEWRDIKFIKRGRGTAGILCACLPLSLLQWCSFAELEQPLTPAA